MMVYNRFDTFYYFLGCVSLSFYLQLCFGSVRQAGGCNAHPSTPNFLQIYKILSTFSVLKPPKAGNCTVYNKKNPESDVIRTVKVKPDNIVNNGAEGQMDLEEIFDHDYTHPEIANYMTA